MLVLSSIDHTLCLHRLSDGSVGDECDGLFSRRQRVAAGVGQWWLVWVSGARQWVLGSSKAANAVYLAVFDLGTGSALSR